MTRSVEDTQTLKQALKRHFRDSGLPEDGGYDEAQWALELQGRIEEIDSGAVQTVPRSEARRQIL